MLVQLRQDKWPNSYPEYLELCKRQGASPELDEGEFACALMHRIPKAEKFDSPREFLSKSSFGQWITSDAREADLLAIVLPAIHLDLLTNHPRYAKNTHRVDLSEIGLKMDFQVLNGEIKSVHIETQGEGDYHFHFYQNDQLVRQGVVHGHLLRQGLEPDGVVWPSNEIFIHITYLSPAGELRSCGFRVSDEVEGRQTFNQIRTFEYGS